MDEYAEVLPIVHLNGTSRQELIDQRIGFGNSLYAALEALSKMCPNGRDYYPEPGRMEKALKAHERRTRMLKMLYKEIENEVLHLETEAE